MDNVKGNSYYIDKIVTNLEFIILHTHGKSKEALIEDEVLLDSVMFRLIQISENAERLTAEFKEQHKSIPWHALKGMRNRIVHDYGKVDLTVVFDTVSRDIPMLLTKLKGI